MAGVCIKPSGCTHKHSTVRDAGPARVHAFSWAVHLGRGHAHAPSPSPSPCAWREGGAHCQHQCCQCHRHPQSQHCCCHPRCLWKQIHPRQLHQFQCRRHPADPQFIASGWLQLERCAEVVPGLAEKGESTSGCRGKCEGVSPVYAYMTGYNAGVWSTRRKVRGPHHCSKFWHLCRL